ncbi:unnamed protein product [Mytilus edulis]|uniref:Ig-like domain-containing protein n=1 Tax=Mytilus edulis TaxID=6550 RepID=A0A8S3VK42_MYTED|nr:unnamed protein product [Mytilus edulis]
MIYVLLVTNLIADVTYLKIQLVGKYATVEIECPFEPKSWFSDKSLSIVVGKDINPNFASKYGLGDVLNLLIYNFTDDIPEEICHFSFKRNSNGSESKRNLLCREYTINQYKYHQANVYVFTNQTSQETVVDSYEKTLNGKIKEYTCLILNSDNCVTSNNTFQLNVQFISGISSEEISGKKKKELTTKVNNYTCDCSPTYAVNNSDCTDTTQMYERNGTLYLDNFKLSTSNTFLCYIDHSDILTEIISTTKFEHAGDINFMQLTYAFGGIAAVLVVILLCAGAVIITMARNKPRDFFSIVSVEDEIQHREPVVPDYLDIIDIVNPHSIEMTNDNLDTSHIPNSTYSRRVSSDYESVDCRSGNTDTSHEQDVVIVDSTNSSPNTSFERGLWKCENIFVKQYSTVAITCPFIEIVNVSVNWHFEQSKIISKGKDVNSKFSSKYSVIRTGNLLIRNFSYADEGQYACQGFIGKEVHEDTVIVKVCRILKEKKSFTEKSTGFLQKQVDVYTGVCSSLNIKTNSNCDENIKIYLTNDVHKVLYLNNFNKTTTETLLCHIYKIDNLEEITTVDHSGISRTDDLPMPIKRKQSIEDEHKHDEDVVPHNVATTDSVNHHSVDLGNCSGGRNSRSNPTLNDNTSSYYQFDVSGNSHTESIKEQKTESVNNTDNYFNNYFENDIYSAGDIYVNTNLMNTYEQLEETTTTDIQAYEDFSYDY